jgi:hypothetical protein
MARAVNVALVRRRAVNRIGAPLPGFASAQRPASAHRADKDRARALIGIAAVLAVDDVPNNQVLAATRLDTFYEPPRLRA